MAREVLLSIAARCATATPADAPRLIGEALLCLVNSGRLAQAAWAQAMDILRAGGLESAALAAMPPQSGWGVISGDPAISAGTWHPEDRDGPGAWQHAASPALAICAAAALAQAAGLEAGGRHAA